MAAPKTLVLCTGSVRGSMQCNAIFGSSTYERPQRIVVLFIQGRAIGGSLPQGCFSVTACGSREASPALLRFLAELSRSAHDAITPHSAAHAATSSNFEGTRARMSLEGLLGRAPAPAFRALAGCMRQAVESYACATIHLFKTPSWQIAPQDTDSTA